MLALGDRIDYNRNCEENENLYENVLKRKRKHVMITT